MSKKALPNVSAPTLVTTLPVSKKKVKYRPFVIKEQKALLLAQESKDADAVMETIKSVIHSCTNGTMEFGKVPTAESLKTYVAYGEMGGSWAPERMNASTFQIKYLISQDGDVLIPNTSENSLSIVQGTFQSGEAFKISSTSPGSGAPPESRNIIRGGTRIEPILYTQSGSAPNAQWNTTINFQDITPSDTGNVGNYTALYGRTGTAQILGYGAPEQVTFNQTLYGTPVTSNLYTIPLNAVQDGIQFTIESNVRIKLENPSFSGNPYSYVVTIYIYKNSNPKSSTGNLAVPRGKVANLYFII